MAKYLRKFETTADYESAKDSLILPNVSLCEDNNGVYYEPVPPPYQGFCKLTLDNGEVVELEGSGELTRAMVSDQYEDTLVSAEIGTLCTSIGDSAFNGCIGLTSIDIPNNVTSIGGNAFYCCFSLTSIDIPDSVTSIGLGAFYQCTSLTNVTIGSGVTSISGWAFGECDSLTSIEIPSGVTSIGNGAFAYCFNLTSITSLATSAPTIISDTFQNVKTGGTLTVPSGSSGYDVWMQNANYYLGLYNWEKVEQ